MIQRVQEAQASNSSLNAIFPTPASKAFLLASYEIIDLGAWWSASPLTHKYIGKQHQKMPFLLRALNLNMGSTQGLAAIFVGVFLEIFAGPYRRSYQKPEVF